MMTYHFGLGWVLVLLPLLEAGRVVEVLVLALLDQAGRAVEAVQEALQGPYHTGLQHLILEGST